MAPHNDLRIYSDYQRSVQSWRALAKLDTRALIRGADAPLLMDLARMKAARKALGLSTKVEKVAAHGRCASQAQALTDGNALADLAAKRAARADEPDPLDLSSAYVRGGPPFLLTLDGLPVYTDARRAARRHVGKLRAERWQNLPTHGLLERLLRFAWPPSVEYSSSKVALAAPPAGVPSSFLIRWRMLCLRTPTQVGRAQDDMAELLTCDGKGDATCPLCANMRDGPPARGDSQHVLLACPVLEQTRLSMRRALGGLLRGVGPHGWWDGDGRGPPPLSAALARLHGLAPGDCTLQMHTCSLHYDLPGVEKQWTQTTGSVSLR